MNNSAQEKVEIRLDIQRMQREIREQKGKREVLNNMELFVLDNSLRESTVGQLRGHTIENKWKIYEQVRGLRGLSPKLACNFVRIIALFGYLVSKQLPA